MSYKNSIMDTMLDLVSAESISGTEKENLGTDKIYSLVKEIPYFREHIENLKMIPIEKDPLKRNFISALYIGDETSKKTLILTGHSDVVDVEEFGHLKDLAFNPVEYTKRVNELPLDKDALKDLQSGEWIFGRGTADMKYGIAMEIEVLRKLCSHDNFHGNVLFLAVPGEESNSEGMLAAVHHLEELQNDGFEFLGLLLSECCLPKTVGEKTKRIYLGSCGKVMPLLFFVGKESHVCEPFNGFSANLLASEVNIQLEFNHELCDIFKSSSYKSITPPPVCLKQSDTKELYSVQSPLYAYSYYNVLTLDFNHDIFMTKLKEQCYIAFNNALDVVNMQKKQYQEISNEEAEDLNIRPCVATYEEIYEKVKEIYGEQFDNYLNDKIEIWKTNKMDNQKIAVNIVKETYEKYPNKAPMIIIGYAPPYYPSKYIDTSSGCGNKFMKSIDATIEYAERQFNLEIQKEDFFMGICDLCYTGVKKEQIENISSNILGINKCYDFPVESLKKLNIPSVVFGGFGKDFHKYSERLNIPYSLEIVPQLYEEIAYNLFK